ncbi:MAG TPA: response regulator transcription factor [Nocardioides sp.]|uniref:response regulator transcription factor n=1 Tax=Nocardioides sp. TaxID=35761 RepID=UPI002E31733D|nr:response regulator transcription factor [Nocardioides sp.]HEX5090818.1 response regulator transcription factor [Nocardioides sp.]
MISVAVVDDQDLVRGGVRMILETEPDLLVAGEGADADTAVRLVAECRPDVLLLDIRMPGEDGLAALGRILALDAPTRVLMLTTFDLDEYVYQALRAGASGFLLKDMAGDEIVHAVRRAASGADNVLAPAVVGRLVDRFTRTGLPGAGPESLSALTPREVEVLQRIASGLSNAEIARDLWIGETTVKTHVARILMKLGLRDRVQAVIVAYQSGLVS